MASNIIYRSCLDQLFRNRLEGSDCHSFDNKVASSFNKMDFIYKGEDSFLCSCESSHIIKTFFLLC